MLYPDGKSSFNPTSALSIGSPAWHRSWYNLTGNYGDITWHLTLSQEECKVFLKLPDQPRWELGATSDTTLFVRTMPWGMHFKKAADGQVTQLTNTQGPLVWKVSKLK
ncbi:hypothetical protein IC229_27705 [Spirosoma sp. BT702]|uniref:Uncharacterized protein n=1 Tax=Spirosoma profusum TaxID=2771354 RepID=A0A927AUI3_9BACT|nr:hypothetical protein [Spirosoma profusum]MBD2704457.1 hypothetical protein [Spirosoma profusum]